MWFPPAKNAWYEEGKPEPAEIFAGKSLSTLLSGAAKLELTHQNLDTVRQRATPQMKSVGSIAKVSEIFQMLEPDQLLTLRSPRCLVTA